MANLCEHTVYIFSDVERIIRERGSTATTTDIDKGYLFGQWTSSFNPVVHGVFARWGNLKREMSDELDDAKDKLRSNYQLCHIGEVIKDRFSPNERDRRQGQYEERDTPGYLILEATSRSIEAFLYRSSSSRSSRDLVGMCRIEKLQGGNPFAGIRVRELKSIADHHGNRRPEYGYGRWGTHNQQADRNTHAANPADEGHPYPGQVARMGVAFETGGREAETRVDQWYSTPQGQETLKTMHEGIKKIASDANVEMKRDAITHDMTFLFKSRGNKWEIAFPRDFPSGFLQLKENTRVGDNRPITIRKRLRIPPILDEIKDIVEKPRGGWR